MTDPIETTTQAEAAVRTVGGIAGAATLIGGLAKLWTVVFGTRAERQAAAEAEAARRQQSHERAADLGLRIAEQEREETQRVRGERNDYATRLAAMDERLRAQDERMEQLEDELKELRDERDELRSELASVRDSLDGALSRCAHLEREQTRARQMLDDYMRPPTPRDGTPSLASLETADHG